MSVNDADGDYRININQSRRCIDQLNVGEKCKYAIISNDGDDINCIECKSGAVEILKPPLSYQSLDKYDFNTNFGYPSSPIDNFPSI